MATPASAVSRPKQCVYVDVPQCPYPTTSHKSAPIHALSSLSRKENTPFKRPSNGGAPHSVGDFPTLKRKTSEQDIPSIIAAKYKKNKLTDPSTVPLPQQLEAENATNGFFYCHQCLKKRDIAVWIPCTSVNTVKDIEKQCYTKFCAPCLKNRYGEDLAEIKARGANGVYPFKTSKGLPANGKASAPKPDVPSNASKPTAKSTVEVLPAPSKASTSTKSKVEAKSRQQILDLKRKATSNAPRPKSTIEVLITTTPSKGAYKSSTEATHPKIAKLKSSATIASTRTKTKADPKPKQQTLHQMIPQTLPVLKWTQVPTSLDLHDAESRFQIREFVLRFASVMEPSIPRVQLAELDDLGCGLDNKEMAPWVSEACVRSLILGLLGILANLKGNTHKPVTAAARDIRATGNNMTKVWPILANLRDALQDDVALSFPDPLPPPASATIYNTRRTRSDVNGGRPNVSIVHSAQMIPVVEALIQAALETSVVRDEMDDGVREGKEMVRKVQKAIREENERWDVERKLLEAERKQAKEVFDKGTTEKDKKEKPKNKTGTKAALEIKLKQETHKNCIRDLEHALKLVMPGFAPRFAPLGTDAAGRTFWIASPGAVERKTAIDFIASESVSKKRKAPAIDEGTPTEWSWFLAVWGVKIPALGTSKDEEDDVERWWAFSEPVEIRKLADWIRTDAGIDPYGEADATKPLALLVKGLNEHAALLDWRMKEDKYGVVA
ncbi:hypothetical protein C0991_011428 [Blastosporella zonata]|nr:hypothetical protein C0991_011428 [Blastosporella zonata]